MNSIKFFKLHGSGNDILVVDNLKSEFNLLEASLSSLAAKLLNRRLGVGADQLMWLTLNERHFNSDLKTRIFNPDGSEAETCGNGLLCVTRYLGERVAKMRNISPFKIEIVGRQITAIYDVDNLSVDMAEPIWSSSDLPKADELGVTKITVLAQCFKCSVLAIPNPHCIIFVPDLTEIDLASLGPAFERSVLFPRRTNVEFVQILDPQRVKALVWERGAGATSSCASASSAIVAAGIKRGLLDNEVTVEMPGGQHRVSFNPLTGRVLLSGPATWIAEGEWII